MTDAEFNRQYAEAGGWGMSVRDDLVCRKWAEELTNLDLLEALRERIAEQMPMDSEMEALLSEIGERLQDADC